MLALLVCALCLAACGDGGSDPTQSGNAHIRFVAPIQFTDCEWDWEIDCGDFGDMVTSYNPPCSEDIVVNQGEEWEGFMDLPPTECTLTISIERGDVRCVASETFQVVRGRQATVDARATCVP